MKRIAVFCVCFTMIHCAVVSNRSRSGLTSIPVDIPPNVTKLLLKQNLITSLNSYVFSSYRDLTYVDLEYNEISWIAPEAFTGCPIDTLLLNYNLLTEFPDFTAIGSSLTNLEMNYNTLQNLSSVDFLNLTALKNLKINWCNLPSDLEFKRGFQSVEGLSMRGSFFYNITSELQNLMTVNSLTLHEGGFLADPITDEEFKGCLNITSLSLDSMQMTKFPQLPKVGKELTKLHLPYNNFVDPLTANQFSYYVMMRRLDLRNCGLSTFPDISPLNATLENLDLCCNNISSVPHTSLEEFKSLKFIHLTDNPLGYIPNLGNASASIKRLDLENTGLVTSTCLNFEPFFNLRRLILAKNNLDDVIWESLQCLRSPLEVLELSENIITAVDIVDLHFLYTLRTLRLAGNPITCFKQVRI